MPFHIRKTSVFHNNDLYPVEESCKRNWITNFGLHIRYWCQWPRGLRIRSAAAHLLRLWVRIPPRAGMSAVSVVYCQGEVCDELITRPEESYLLCCVVVCDLETSIRRRPWPALGRSATKKKWIRILLLPVHRLSMSFWYIVPDPAHLSRSQLEQYRIYLLIIRY
jgi:hypothetical protein